MNRILLVIGAIVLVLGVFIPTANSGSTICVESVVQLTPGVVICAGSTSTLQGVQYGTVWLNSASPVEVTGAQPSTPVTWHYTLGTGLTLTSFSAEYCTSTTEANGVCPAGSPAISVTNHGLDPSTGTYSFSGETPSISGTATYYFEGHITDSSGKGYSAVGLIQLVEKSYSITVTVTDLQTGDALTGAQVQLYTNNEVVYATQSTVSGSTTFSVPYFSTGYFFVVTDAGYVPYTSGVLLTGPASQTVAVKLQTTDLATITSSTFLDTCTVTIGTDTQTVTFTATTIYLTSAGGSSTYAQSTGSSPCTPGSGGHTGGQLPGTSSSLDYPVIAIGAIIMFVGALLPETGVKKVAVAKRKG